MDQQKCVECGEAVGHLLRCRAGRRARQFSECERLTAERDAALARVAELEAERDQLRAGAGQLMSSKDSAYTERNRCVAAIARLALANGWRAGLGSHHGDDLAWDPEWRTIVFIDLPAGQVSWHLHDSEVGLFEGLPAYRGAWDGHSTPEKYARLDELRRWRSNLREQRDAALAVVERVRELARGTAQRAVELRRLERNQHDLGRATAYEDVAAELETVLPPR